MSREVQAIELMSEELEGTRYSYRRADINHFLIRAEKEMTPENHEKFRRSLSRVLDRKMHIIYAAMSFDALFGSNTGLKFEFNKFVGAKFKLRLNSNARTQEAAALWVCNVDEEQSSPESGSSGSAEMCIESSNDLSSLSADGKPESGALPTTFAGIVPEQSPNDFTN